jgi:transcriptional regulator with XRE-family HTH domain
VPESTTRLGLRRQELKLTQEEVADLVGVTSRTVQAWERGENRPRGKALRAYAGVLHWPIAEVLEEAPEPGALERIEAKIDRLLGLAEASGATAQPAPPKETETEREDRVGGELVAELRDTTPDASEGTGRVP